MTHDELLAELDSQVEISKAVGCDCKSCDNTKALRAVVELHKCSHPRFDLLCDCGAAYPCPTIQAIEKELK